MLYKKNKRQTHILKERQRNRGKKIEFNKLRCIKYLYLVVVKEHGTLEPSLASTLTKLSGFSKEHVLPFVHLAV